MIKMNTHKIKVKTQVRAGAAPCTNTTYPYFKCYVGKKQTGQAEPTVESGAMSVGNCLTQLKALSSDYACYVA